MSLFKLAGVYCCCGLVCCCPFFLFTVKQQPWQCCHFSDKRAQEIKAAKICELNRVSVANSIQYLHTMLMICITCTAYPIVYAKKPKYTFGFKIKGLEKQLTL